MLSTPVNEMYVYTVLHYFQAKTGTAMAIPAIPMEPALTTATPETKFGLHTHNHFIQVTNHKTLPVPTSMHQATNTP